MHKEERALMIGGPTTAGPTIPFVLREPFQMTPRVAYEFHVLYTLLVDDPGLINLLSNIVKLSFNGSFVTDMVDENQSYEYDVTWSASPLTHTLHRKVGHGITFKMNYKVEDEEDDEGDVDHDQTPRWIHTVDFKCKVSQEHQQLCTVS